MFDEQVGQGQPALVPGQAGFVDQGVAHLDAKTDRVTLTNGPTTLFDTTTGAVGSALIIHANEDDQQTDASNGGSGGRIACGVIVAG